MGGIFSGRGRRKLCAAVIAAAGSSTRMEGTDKMFAMLGGMTVLGRTLTVFQNNPHISEIVVVARAEELEQVRALVRSCGITKAADVVEGGATRLQSVYNGVFRVSRKAELIAVQDGARPLVTDAVIDAAIDLAAEKSAAEPAVPVKDTIKRVKNGAVAATPDRSELYAVQTPQVFDADLLKGALQSALEKGLVLTDDAMAVEALGARVYISAGDDENLKITTPADLLAAEAIVRGRAEKET